MWKTITLQPPTFDKRALNHKSAKALLFEPQVEKARQILQDARTWDGKDFKARLFQEFRWDVDTDVFSVELHGKLRNGKGNLYVQDLKISLNSLNRITYHYHCTCPDHANRGSTKPCEHVLAQVLAFLKS